MQDLDLIRSYRGDVDGDEAARAVARKALRDHMAASGARRKRRRRSRRLGWTLAILLVATSGAAAARLVLTSDDVSLGAVACLDAPRTMSDLGSSVFVEPTGDPVAACARVWRAGHLGGPRGAAPELVACVSAGRPVVVVPGGPGTCAELGLEPLPDDYAASAAAFGRAKGILLRDWDLNRPRSACEHPATALRHARDLLREAGVRGVGVELAGTGPCAGPPSFSEGGAVVRYETFSREHAADRYEFRITTALEPLAANGECEAPRRAAERARRLLADARVAVRVETQAGPCFEPGGYRFAPGVVILQAGGR